MQCAADGFRAIARKQGVRFISYRNIPFPAIVPRTVAFRWLSSANGVRLYADIVVLMRSRAQAAIFFVSPVGPTEKSKEAELARIVAGRMAQAMRGA